MYVPYDAFSITLLYTRDLVFNLRHRNQLVLAVIPSDDCVDCLVFYCSELPGTVEMAHIIPCGHWFVNLCPAGCE